MGKIFEMLHLLVSSQLLFVCFNNAENVILIMLDLFAKYCPLFEFFNDYVMQGWSNVLYFSSPMKYNLRNN